MKKLIVLIFVFSMIITPVNAMSFDAPEAPNEAQRFLPENTESFAEGLLFVIKSAVDLLNPSITKALSVCLVLVVITLVISLFYGITQDQNQLYSMVCTVCISLVLFPPTGVFIQEGIETVNELSDYGKLLLPVMTAALSAQGYPSASGALYMGTALFSTLLVNGITKLVIPMIYVYLCVCILYRAIASDVILSIRSFIKWGISWGLKLVLYVFTGFLTISGVVGGTTDASALKAAKIAISGSVPLVGGIISDASESILVSAGIMKNAAGIYGILALIAICIGPFLNTGIQYILLKITSGVCSVLSEKKYTAIINDFSDVMGMVLAMTGTVCLLHLISTVCFLKGAG